MITIIPNNTVVNSVESTFDGEVIEMEFDQGAMKHLMSVLSNQYADPALAVGREYITNALDSHKEAGVTAPVKVTAPSNFNLAFTVQDFGIGMDLNDIRNTYSRYGASTKRDSNDYNGTLGIGSKSAFAYSNQFTVVAVKNGVRTHVVVSLAPDGGGEMNIVDQRDTDEGNGVTISVPVKNAYEFNERLYNFASFLPPGAITINGEEPSKRSTWKSVSGGAVDKNGREILKGIYISDNISEDVVVMGNVAYPMAPFASVPYNLRLDGMSVIAEVPIGVVQFAPSRESLMDLPLTRKILEYIVAEYSRSISKTGQELIDAAESKAQAFSAYLKYSSFFSAGGTTPTYQGQAFPSARTSGSSGIQFFPGWDRGGVQTGISIPYERMDRRLYVYGYKATSGISATHKRKIRQWLRDNNYTYPSYRWSALGEDQIESVFFVENQPTDPWLTGLDWISWEDINAIQLNTGSSGSRGGNGVSFGGKHYVYDPNVYVHAWPEARYIDTKTDKNIEYIVYAKEMSTHRLDAIDFFTLLKAYKDKCTKDVTIVGLYAGRKDKFARDFPKSSEITVNSMRASLAKHYKDNVLDPKDIIAKASTDIFDHRTAKFIRALRAQHKNVFESIEDSELLAMWDGIISDASDTNLANFRYQVSRLGVPGRKVLDEVDAQVEKKANELSASADKIMAQYPLIEFMALGTSWHGAVLTKPVAADIIEYINNKFNS